MVPVPYHTVTIEFLLEFLGTVRYEHLGTYWQGMVRYEHLGTYWQVTVRYVGKTDVFFTAGRCLLYSRTIPKGIIMGNGDG